MSIIGSILFGFEGKYKIFNTPISFEPSETLMESESSSFFVLGVRKTLSSCSFRIATLNNTHFLIHEMGHALTQQMFFSKEYHSKIVIFTDRFGAYTTALKCDQGYKSSLIYLAGPLADIIYSCVQVAAAVLIGKYVSKLAGYLLGSSSVI